MKQSHVDYVGLWIDGLKTKAGEARSCRAGFSLVSMDSEECLDHPSLPTPLNMALPLNDATK